VDLGRRISLSSSLVLKGLTMLGHALSCRLYIGRFIDKRLVGRAQRCPP